MSDKDVAPITRKLEYAYMMPDEDNPGTIHALVTAHAEMSTGRIDIEVPAATEGRTAANARGESRPMQRPGEGSLELNTGPPVFIFAAANGPVECHPLGTIDIDRPFVFDARWAKDQLCPGGMRTLRFANRSPRPVRVALEILYDVQREDLPKRLRRDA